MASEDEMLADLAAADSAGDHELAQHIAGQIKAARVPAAPPQIGTADALASGALRGASMGFGNRAVAGWKSIFGQPYAQNVAQMNARDKAAEQQHPVASTVGEIAGGAGPGTALTLLSGGAVNPLTLAIGQGAAQGAGNSDGKNLARDTLLGGATGAAGYGLGSLVGKASGALAGFARGRAGAAVAKAQQKAADEIAAEIASARGSLGGEVQKGSRLVENLQRFGTQLGPQEQTAADALAQRVAQSNLQSLPGQVATIDTKDAALQAAKQGASAELKRRTAELLSTAEAKRQLAARALRYGPVAAGTALGALIGGPLGTGVGALAGAGSRPMIRSVMRMAQTPAVQKAGFDALANVADNQTAGQLLRALMRGAAGPAISSMETP